MFILRRITCNDVQTNEALGGRYSLINRTQNPTDFESCVVRMGGKVPDTNYAFITGEGKLIPLDSADENYIMTESGKTFSNVSKK